MPKIHGIKPRVHLPFMACFGEAGVTVRYREGPGFGMPAYEHAVKFFAGHMIEVDDVDVPASEENGKDLVLKPGLRLFRAPGVEIFGVHEHPLTQRIDWQPFKVDFDDVGGAKLPTTSVDFGDGPKEVEIYPAAKLYKAEHPNSSRPAWTLGPSDCSAIVCEASDAYRGELRRIHAREPFCHQGRAGWFSGVLIREAD